MDDECITVPSDRKATDQAEVRQTTIRVAFGIEGQACKGQKSQINVPSVFVSLLCLGFLATLHSDALASPPRLLFFFTCKQRENTHLPFCAGL